VVVLGLEDQAIRCLEKHGAQIDDCHRREEEHDPNAPSGAAVQ
jgi:hypothetical protein